MNTQDLLTQYLDANDDSTHKYMEPLVDAIRRTIQRCLTKREVGDLEDFEEDCLIAVWTRINAIRQDVSVDGIDNLEGFIRRTVHNRYCDAIRRKRPSWYNLKLELLETFSGRLNVEGFALWQSSTGSDRLCGFTDWEGRTDLAVASCRGLADSPQAFLERGIGNRNPSELSVPELAAAVLDWVKGPVGIDDLTSCLAGLLHLKDYEPLSIDSQPEANDDMGSPVDWLIASDIDVEEQVVGNRWLKQVLNWFWQEFQQLSLKQRKAIFFGLMSEQAVTIITSCGVDNVAQALETERQTLVRLLGKLPIPDTEIAGELEIPPRSVPSVRFKAWRRIQRRAHKSELMAVDVETVERD